MPRKSSRAVKKDAASESKSEGEAPRRSGRAVTKVETTPSSGKDASRSRRSSTAAQTAASVADSRTPKSRSSTRRGSVSPSEGRSKSNRDSVESPATRVKSTRRSTGHINYKESDGEEEAATPKYDENFDSTEEFEDSESDDNSKNKGRNRSSKIIAKSPTPKEKTKGSSGRKSRSTKKKSDDDNEEAEACDDVESIETESIPSSKNAKQTPAKAEESKEAPKSGRGRRAKAEKVESKPTLEEKPKPSRRSVRSSSNKEEAQKKRPSRSVQAKKYTEEEEEELDEIDDSKAADEKVKTEVGSQKRKRSSSTEPNKRAKKDASENELKELDDDDDDDLNDKLMVDETEVKNEKDENDKASEEPMEVDESESNLPEKSEKSADSEESCNDSTLKPESKDKENVDEKESKEKLSVSDKKENIDSSKHADEDMHSSDSEQESQLDHSVSSGMEDSQDVKENKNDSSAGSKILDEVSTKHQEIELASQSSESFQQIDENSEESKDVQLTAVCSEQKQEKLQKETEKVDLKRKDENVTNDKSVEENKAASIATSVLSSTSPASTVHSKQSTVEPTVNGPDNSSSVSNTTPVIHTNSTVKFDSSENLPPNANGEHNLHSNSISPKKDQYYLLPGRKYVVNSKLNENMRQSLKAKSFGFVSWSLGSSSSDVCLQKDKLLNELKCLEGHIICLQQVSKAFYNSALEPSLHANGFKGVFSQPEESLKGMATFYKTSLFKLNKHCETSLKQLIEKELEASSLDSNDRAAVRAHVKRCGNILLTNFSTLSEEEDTITVANVQVPVADLSIQALQVSCIGQEVFRINGGVNRPLLIGGELNMKESEASYQLLRDGYLSNEMIEELNRKKDVVLPGKENASLINLMWKSYRHPSSNLSSCYKTVLDHEVFIPDKKITSPDLLWFSSDCLHTIGVLDLISDRLTDHHLSLKADIAFSP